MTQALYYAPSYQRFEQQIREIAPELEVVLLDAEGNLSLHGKPVTQADISPQWFWVHSELMSNKTLLPEYFDLVLKCPSAEWMHTINTGLDGLPYPEVLQQGITLTNNHSQAPAIADFVLGQVLDHYQKHALLKAQQAEDEWKHVRFTELADTRWLIVGFGHIGQQIAARAKAFGVHIDVVRRKQETEGLADRVFSQTTIHQPLAEADVVVLTCTPNDETRNMVNAGFLDTMKEGSVLVNIARGDLIDEEALLAALDAGKPALAILDVFRQEPLPGNSPFWKNDRVVITPHCSFAGSGMLARSDALFLDNLERMVSGGTLRNTVSEKEVLT